MLEYSAIEFRRLRATSDSKPQPRRGRILTEEGWRKLETAVRGEYPYDGIEPDFEQIALKVAAQRGCVGRDTVAKIWNREEGADRKYIKAVGRTFGLSFQERVDYIFAADAPKDKPPLSPSDRPTETGLDDGRTRWVGREGRRCGFAGKTAGGMSGFVCGGPDRYWQDFFGGPTGKKFDSQTVFARSKNG